MSGQHEPGRLTSSWQHEGFLNEAASCLHPSFKKVVAAHSVFRTVRCWDTTSALPADKQRLQKHNRTEEIQSANGSHRGLLLLQEKSCEVHGTPGQAGPHLHDAHGKQALR